MKRFTKCVALLLITAALLELASCASSNGEVPEGMKNATAAGDDFRLYIPINWNANTIYGVSGGYATLSEQSTVSVTKHAITPETEAQMQAELTRDGGEVTGERRIDWFWNNRCLPSLRELSEGSSFSEAEAKSQALLNKYNAWRYHWKGVANGTPLHFLQIIAEKDGAFYLFAFTAVERQYQAQLSNVELMLDHFVFAEPYAPDENAKVIDPNAPAPEGMKLASNDDVAYRFYVPTTWAINANEGVFAAYLESDRSSVSVVPYMPEVESISVAQYFELCEKIMKETAGEYELLAEPETLDLGGRQATVYVYRYTVGGREYRYKQVIAAYKSMIYSLTYTSTPENFDAHLADVDAMIDAFEFR
ncbi:MAG: hypothetical protein IKJ35_04055 [Clostridia bacterium]|nr:hypothetical protein [Clostridia bacterium]